MLGFASALRKTTFCVEGVLDDVSLITAVSPTFFEDHLQNDTWQNWGWRVWEAHMEIVREDNFFVFGTNHVCQQGLAVYPHITCIDEDVCMHSRYKMPLVNCIFERVHQLVSTEYMLYVNSDVLLRMDFVKSFRFVKERFRSFLLVSQRIDLRLEILNNIHDLQNFLLSMDRNTFHIAGKMHEISGIDLFLYSVDAVRWTTFPPFLLGNIRWDNWLLKQFLANPNITTVDFSPLKQLYHLGVPDKRSHYRGPQTRYNLELFRRLNGSKQLSTVRDCTFYLVKNSTTFAFQLLANNLLSSSRKRIRRAKKPYFEPWLHQR